MQRMKQRKIIHSRVVFSVLLPYYLMAIALILLFSSGLYVSYRIISAKNAEAIQKRQEEIVDIVYQRMTRYRKIGDVLATNNYIITFGSSQAKQQEEYLEVISSLQRELSNVSSIANVEVRQLATYYPTHGLLVTSSAVYDGKKATAGDSVLDYLYHGVITEETLNSIPEHNSWRCYYGERTGWIVRKMNNRDRVIAYVIVEYAWENLVPLTGYDDVILIGDDESYIYTNKADMSKDEYRGIRQDLKATRSFAYNSQEYRAIQCISSLMNMNIMVGIPLPNAMSVMGPVLIWLGILCILLLMIWYKIVYSRVLLPVKYLAEESELNGDFRAILSTARNNLLSLKNQKEAAEAEQKMLIPLGVGELLRRICLVSESEATRLAGRCLSLIGIRPGQKYFMVGLFQMEDEHNFFPKQDDKEPKVTPLFILNNILTDVLFSERIGVVATVGHYFIVIFDCLEKDSQENMWKTINWLLEYYKTNFRVILAATQPLIGDNEYKLKEITESTLNEIAFLEFWNKSQSVSDTIKKQTSLTTYFKSMRNLVNRLDDHDYIGAQDVFERILNENLPTSAANFRITRHRIYGIFAVLVAAFTERTADSDDMVRQLDYEQRLYEIDNITTLRNETKQIFSELIDFHRMTGLGKSGPQKIEAVKNYIREHYTERSMTGTSLADHFNLSSSYLSREFRRVTGYNLLEYIQRLQIDLAKTMLEKHSVKDTAEKVGFLDVQGLTRVFKKYEAITPGEYKRMIDKKRKEKRNILV